MTVVHNMPDIILIEKAIPKWTVIDITIPGDFNVVRREDWKVEKYQDLALELKRIHHAETSIISQNKGRKETGAINHISLKIVSKNNILKY